MHKSESVKYKKSNDFKLNTLINVGYLFVDIGNSYYDIKKYDNMIICYMAAIEYVNSDIGKIFLENYDIKSDELCSTIAMHNLAIYYNEIEDYVNMKKYCILAFLKNPKAITPFAINKT
jgi:tetratricopeptide (TPR) repeat protein